jgi:hypothetical protein
MPPSDEEIQERQQQQQQQLNLSRQLYQQHQRAQEQHAANQLREQVKQQREAWERMGSPEPPYANTLLAQKAMERYYSPHFPSLTP